MYSCAVVLVAGDWNIIPPSGQPHIQPVAMTLCSGVNQTFSSGRKIPTNPDSPKNNDHTDLIENVMS